MVYDCFTFFNELELLDIRLHELNDVVDKFVLIEGTVTFTNKKKPLYYDRNKLLFKRFKKKIIHVVVNDSPKTKDPWDIERFQFNSIKKGLKNAKDNDTILLSCVDEIPKAHLVNEWKNKNLGEVKIFLQTLSYYFLNNIAFNYGLWKGTRMLRYEQVKKLNDLYSIRNFNEGIEIKNGGWHFSYVGGVSRIKMKIGSYSHKEFNKSKYTSKKNINNALTKKIDLFERNIKFKTIDYKYLPNYIQKNKEKFLNILLPERKFFLFNLIKLFKT